MLLVSFNIVNVGRNLQEIVGNNTSPDLVSRHVKKKGY